VVRQPRERDAALAREVVQQLTLVLTQVRLVAAVQRTPHAPVRQLVAFRI
jgi:hypothetical protein